jgi:hypothetical protein
MPSRRAPPSSRSGGVRVMSIVASVQCGKNAISDGSNASTSVFGPVAKNYKRLDTNRTLVSTDTSTTKFHTDANARAKRSRPRLSRTIVCFTKTSTSVARNQTVGHAIGAFCGADTPNAANRLGDPPRPNPFERVTNRLKQAQFLVIHSDDAAAPIAP